MVLEQLKEKAAAMPDSPGIYMMKDGTGRVIYVGKAKSLPKRVSTYFQKTPDSPRIAMMVGQVSDVDFMVTENEKEALILENSLIKKHRPRYNIILRDDKTYPSLRLTVQEEYPRLEVVRRVTRDGAVYFGPFSSATAMRHTMKLIKHLFPLRQCRRPLDQAAKRPCLNYQLGRCLGPCQGHATKDEYHQVVDEVILFFEGKNKALTESLKAKMREASANLDFEAAARYRDRLADVERTLEKQIVATHDMKDQDVIGLARERGQNLAVILFVRRGTLLGSHVVPMSGESDRDEDLIETLIGQYYSRDVNIPDEVIAPMIPEAVEALQDWLRQMKGRSVKIFSPSRGPKRKLLDLARQNAETALAERFRAADLGTDVLVELQMKLDLPNMPRRIECYDMSTLRGDAPVGAMVVLQDGKWIKPDYRRFKIKQASGQDDYAMMKEVLGRRLVKEELPRPDLILLDGGRGQLGVAMAVVEDLEIKDAPPLAGLAKGREGEADKVWRPGRKNPIDFKSDAPGLLLLMRARDEAHRYVQAFHHQRRAKALTRSELEDIPGIGPGRRKSLLMRFGSIERIREADVKELGDVKGMNDNSARAVYDYFRATKVELSAPS